MASNDDKKRHRPNDEKSEYPYNQVTQTAGGHEIHLNSTPDEESYRLFHPAGTSTIINKDGKKTSLVADHEYKTNAGGRTHTTEGTYDRLIGGGERRSNWGGRHDEAAGSISQVTYENYVRAVKGGMFRYSTGPTEHCSEGGHFNDHNDGANHGHSKSDNIFTTGGVHYGMSEGEWGQYAQGNMDFKTDKKGRFYSEKAMLVQANDTWDAASLKSMTLTSKDTFTANSKKDMTLTTQQSLSANAQQSITIEAQQSITIKCGSSKIEISPSSITLTSPSINFSQG